MDLIFATHNKNKLKELRNILDTDINIKGLNEIGYFTEIEETGATLKENAIIKAKQIFNKYNTPVIADDTGLETDALNGEPGVLSARYAGEDKNSTDNINKLLKELSKHNNRKARFKTVIAFITAESEHTFEGSIEGSIAVKPTGDKGFGYDPVFIPQNYNISFAEMDGKEKNKISHRAEAVTKLANFLSKEYKNK
ncbi:RdgB/HAM1 family non-canonical purine NTP pyrophosphatase [Marinilabiliaceae bacterium ANBcel2]|nr:RdgB/HAM1 family non-canonical purine NTP pyrophosphatase [Marinilabiliaceae bacterium ANBcel2]